MRSRARSHRKHLTLIRLLVAMGVVLGASGGALSVVVAQAHAEGSVSLYPGPTSPACAPNSAGGSCRANIEWRTSSYGPATGPQIPRRDLFYVYMTAGQVVLVGSSAVGVVNGATEGN